MFNPFPELLTYSLLASFLLRTMLGFVFIRLGIHVLTTERHEFVEACNEIYRRMFGRLFGNFFGNGMAFAYITGVFEIAVGAMLVLGFYTQIAAAAVILTSLKFIFYKLIYPTHLGKSLGGESVLFYLLTLGASLSLLFSGAGFFAIDLPL